MLSSVFVNNVTPLTLFEFAQNQYEAAIKALEELFRQDAVTYLTNTSVEYLANIGAAIADGIINQYELNDNASLIYGDSVTYNATTGEGVKNWPATMPFFKLAFPVQPQLTIDDDRDLVGILHHDGHRSNIQLEPVGPINLENWSSLVSSYVIPSSIILFVQFLVASVNKESGTKGCLQ